MCSRTLIEGFTLSLKNNPTSKAVIDIKGSYTYEELEEKSNRIADKLLSMGLGGKRVAIILPRTKDFVLTILAVCKAGSAYVPIEPDYPADRVKSIYEDADFKAILTDRGVLKNGVREVCSCVQDDHVLYVSEIVQESEVTAHIDEFNIDRENVLIYTSGSTGKPKGVIHNGYFWEMDPLLENIGYKDKTINFVSISRFTFLASMFVAIPLMTGGAFYVANEEETVNLRAMSEIISKYDMDGIFMPPRLADTFFKMYPDAKVRFALMAGEALSQVPDTKTELFNLYGATEANTMLVRRVKKTDKVGAMGRPIFDDASICLIDDNGNIITENNRIGEFCIASHAVSMGYSNLPELNKEKFVASPNDPSRIMFKTADLMERDTDGNLIFHGRKDNMVKIAGYRIELGEVESHLTELECIQECVCVVRNIAGTDNLVCYYVKNSDFMITENDLRERIATKVPHYMVPSMWIEMDKLPRNANGKVDRKALQIQDAGTKTKKQIVAGTTPEEVICLKIAKKLLPDVEFGVTDDLQSVGMTSLKCVEYVCELEKIGLKFSVSDVMRHKNIRMLLTSKRRIFNFYREYDKNKPVLVVTQGIIYISALMDKLDAWSEYFNVFTFDLLSRNQFNMLFQGESIEEVTALYADLLDLNMPEGADVAGFAGFSWGGDLAVHTALKWHELYDSKGRLPFVFLCDSYTSMAEPFHLTTEEEIKMAIEKFHVDETVLRDSVEKRNVATMLNFDRDITTEHYDGKCIYLNAMKGVPSEILAKKIGIVKSVFSNLEIHDFPETEHNDLFIKAEMVPVLTDLLKEQIK